MLNVNVSCYGLVIGLNEKVGDSRLKLKYNVNIYC
jgi:hypothetical protein